MIPHALTELFSTFAAASWRAGWLILALIVLRRLVRGRIPAQVWFVVWIVVALRLLVPVSLPANWSPYNWSPARPAAVAQSVAATRPVEEIAAEAEQLPSELAVEAVAALRAASAPPAYAPTAADSPSPGAPPAPGWHTLELAALVWLAGAILLAGTRLWVLARFRRQLRGTESTADVRLAATVAEEAGRLRAGAVPPACIETEAVDAPALFGIARPCLLFPPALAAQLTDEELRLVVRHELAHWRRRDLLAQALVQAAVVVHWFNPLVWFAARLARNDAELACDEFVLRREAAGGPTAYGSTLLKVLGITPRGRRRLSAGVGIFESGQQLAQRVRTIAGYRAASRAGLLGGVMLVAAVALASLTRETRAAGQEPVVAPTMAANAGTATPPSIAEAAPGAPPSDAIAGPPSRPGAESEKVLARFYQIKERRAQGGSLAEIPFVAADPRISQLRRQEEGVKAEIARLSRIYREPHPTLQAAEARLTQLAADLNRAAEAVCHEVEEAHAALARAKAERRAGEERARTAKTQAERSKRLERERRATMAQRILRESEEGFRASQEEVIRLRRESESLILRIEAIRQQERAKRPMAELPFIASQPLVARLNEELVTGRIESATLRARYAETHPEVVAWTKRMAQIALELERAVSLAVERIKADFVAVAHQQERAGEEVIRAKTRLMEADREFSELRADNEEDAVREATPLQPVTAPFVRTDFGDPRTAGDFVVRIVGAVNRQGPVTFTARDKPLVLDVIAHAGGFTPSADREAIQVFWMRDDGRREHLQPTEAEVMFGSIGAAPGATIVVPEKGKALRPIRVSGAVYAPGTIALAEDSVLTLAELLNMAGKPTQMADLSRVRVTRMEPHDRQPKTSIVDLSAPEADSPGFAVRGGDVVFVPFKPR